MAAAQGTNRREAGRKTLVLKLLIAFSGAVLLAVATVFVLGARCPKDHEVRVKRTVPAPPEKVFATLDDVSTQVRWFPGLTAAEKLSATPERWREHVGQNSFVLETVEKRPNTLLERTIRDDHGPFTGSWRFELEDDGAGTMVTLVEKGHVESIPGRFFLHYGAGPEAYAKSYLDALAGAFAAP